MKNNNYIKQIIKIFDNNQDLRIAHKKSEDIMKQIVEDKNSINEIVEFNLSQPDFWFKKRHYPTLALSVFTNELIDIVINIYPALPNGDLNTSFQSIHHHGNLMLSTIGLSGPGYSSISFKKDFVINKNNNACKMEIAENYQNELKKYYFCDAYQPHIVFYPKKISSTLALWSKTNKSKLDKIKILFPRNLKKKLSFALQKLGINKTVNINIPQYYDFYVENNSIFAMKNRIHYPIGSNDNFIQNIFYYFQTINYDNFKFLENLSKKDSINEVAKKWITKYLNKEAIIPSFEDIHLDIDKRVNINKEDIESIFKS